MKTITVSESALDSIKRSKADAARIAELENTLKVIATWAKCDNSSQDSRITAMRHIRDQAMSVLRVSPNVQTIAKGEN